MFPAKIEMRDKQGCCRFQVFDFLGKTEHQAGETPIENADAQVCAFDV
jgi:hypothetical protein